MAIKWSELYRWSMVEIEFGTPKDYISDLDCVDIQNKYYFGINLQHEFSFRHRAIIVSKSYKGTKVSVIPITEWNPNKNYDLDDKSKIFIKREEYPAYFSKDSIILIDEIQTINKKSRIKKIIKSFIPTKLKKEISSRMKEFYVDF